MTCPSQTHCPRHVRRGNALWLYSEIHKVHIFATVVHNTRGTSIIQSAFFALLTTALRIICGSVTIPHVHVCVWVGIFLFYLYLAKVCVLYCIVYCVRGAVFIHLYLIWSGTIGGTMCEREALSIRMGGGQHIEPDTTEQQGKRKPLRRHRSSSPQSEPPLLYIT